jgi:hemolysin activation/secretion protein
MLRAPLVLLFPALLWQNAAGQVLVQGVEMPAAEVWAVSVAREAGASPERMADLLIQHLGRHDMPVVSVEARKLAEGGIELTATEGRLGQISALGGSARQQRVAGAAWQRLVDLPGLRLSHINEMLTFYHRNPRHAMIPQLSAGAEENTADVLADLSGSPRSWGVSAGWANDGVEPLAGERRWIEVEEADLFGFPHLFSLRASSGEDADAMRGLRGQLRCFLPWQHELQLYGIVNQGSLEHDGVQVDANTWQAGFRYVIPSALPKSWQGELALGADLRQTDNTFLAGGDTVGNVADSFHFLTEFGLSRETTSTLSGVRVELGGSPGGLSSANTDAAFANLRELARAAFWYAKGSVWHRKSWGDWYLLGKASGQYTSQPVLPQDQFALGGTYGVRGYAEASGLVDRALFTSLELGGPAWRGGRDAIRFAIQPSGFIDAGWGRALGEARGKQFTSAGLGVRLQLGKFWSMSIDHAWKLEESGSRFHLGATCKF